ncbi:hypothetical protein VNO77_01134 [Canavalia gladiata]|uniref:glutathione transferase n=1 Tax=Canavalia gladiata TaxID=3824 RepID=A0AAN9MQM9_CANGL
MQRSTWPQSLPQVIHFKRQQLKAEDILRQSFTISSNQQGRRPSEDVPIYAAPRHYQREAQRSEVVKEDMGSQDVKVVNFWASPFGKRVEWALKLKGVEYEYVEEDIFNKSNLLLELNPVHKKVPVLIHAQKPIAESFIILEYIDETWKQYPLLPQHPYERAHARFWANVGEQKLLEAAWVAMCISGDEKENALKVAREAIEKIEEEIKGKKFFGGDNIGYLDIALGWISYWLPIWEEVGSTQIIDPLKCSAITAWITNFLSHPAIKDTLPPRDKMLDYFHSRRKALSSTFQGRFKV